MMLLGVSVHADNFTGMANKGNKSFKDGDYSKALEYYHQAEVERPEMPELQYNIGSALYKEGKYEEAAEKFQKSFVTEKIENEAMAQYNLGNVFYKMGDYQKAIQSYQKSLELVPDDLDTKYNLELARKMLKEQLKPQEQDKQQQQQKQEQQQQQKNQDEQKQEQEQDQQQQNQEQQKQEQQQYQEGEMTKEDAERILNALKDDEKEIQKDIRQMQGPAANQGNDW
jgi:tetratricopeptide (TPR) repeat protein